MFQSRIRIALAMAFVVLVGGQALADGPPADDQPPPVRGDTTIGRVPPAADDPAASDPLRADGVERDVVARLEARLRAQQARLEQLESALAADAQQDTARMRTEALRAQIRAMLSEQEFRETLVPTLLQAGYDDGFFIRSSDERFSLVINGFLQMRWQHYGTQARNRYLLPGLERDDRTGFDLARVRLDFGGHAFSEDLTYFIELEADAADAYSFILGEGWINYRFDDAFQMKAGLFKAASTRASIMANGALQFVDRPVFDAVYGLGFGIGVRFWGELFDSRVNYYVDVLNSLGSGEDFAIGTTITPDPAQLDSNPAVVARLIWHVLAENPQDGLPTVYGKDFIEEADLTYHESPALDLGFHYAFNEDRGDVLTTRLPVPIARTFANRGGGFGLVPSNGVQLQQFGVDAAMKYQGFSATAEYALRIIDPRTGTRRPFAAWTLASGDTSTTVQHGAYGQVGYFLPIPGWERKLELVARLGAISALAERQQASWEYAAGVNYYIRGNNVKLQFDVTRIDDAPISNSYSGIANVNDDILLARMQLQLAF